MTRVFLLSSLLAAFLFQGCKTGSEVAQTDTRAADRMASEPAPERVAARLSAESPSDSFEGMGLVMEFDELRLASLSLYHDEFTPEGLGLVGGNISELWVLSQPVEIETALSDRAIVVFDSEGARYPALATSARILSHYSSDVIYAVEEAGCELDLTFTSLECPTPTMKRSLLSKLFREGRRQLVVELEGLSDLGSGVVYRLAATNERARYIAPAREEYQLERVPNDIRSLAEGSHEFEAARAVALRETGLSELEELFTIARFRTAADEYYAVGYSPGCDDLRGSAFTLYQLGEPSKAVELAPSLGGVAMLFEARDRGELLGVGYSISDGLFSLFRVGDQLTKPVHSFNGEPCDC